MLFPRRLLLSLMLFASTAHADDWTRGWDKTDSALAGAAFTLKVIDWKQTRYIARHPDQHREWNPVLGEHPSIGRVNNYFVGSIITSGTIAYFMPGIYRKVFLAGNITVSAWITHHNRSVGIRADW